MGTGWNYRLVRTDHGGGIRTFAIHEVFYDEKGRVFTMTKDPIEVFGYSRREAKRNLDLMAEAFRAPVLASDSVPDKGAGDPLPVDLEGLEPMETLVPSRPARARRPVPRGGAARGRTRSHR